LKVNFEPAPKAEAKVEATVETVQATAQPTSFDSPEAEAKYYRSQADKLAKEAAVFRKRAEDLVPTVKKKAKDPA
jgi:hypothetical protein